MKLIQFEWNILMKLFHPIGLLILFSLNFGGRIRNFYFTKFYLWNKIFPLQKDLMIRPSFHLTFRGQFVLKWYNFQYLSRYILYTYCRKKKESEAGNLFGIHNTVHLNWFSVSELHSRRLKIHEMFFSECTAIEKFLLSPWKKTKI